MQKKRVFVLFTLIFGILISVFYVSFASAQCDVDQTIMKLYQPNNSHGALWNDDHGYNYDICYPDIFGLDYAGGTPHPTCDSNNAILWLSNTYNSHASTSESDYYDTPVCYGDLGCSVTEDEAECADLRGEIVVSLYQNNNSHISFGDDQDYPVKICCILGAEVTGASWADMMEVGISNADLNDEVKLMVAGGGLGGRDIQYEIWEVDGGFLWFDSQVGELDSIGIATWKANQSGEYYFKASLDGGSTWISSEQNTNGILTVSPTSDNTPAELKIISPACGIDINNGGSVSVQVLVDDDDTPWNGTLDFGDGIITVIKNGMNNLPSHQYDDAGNMKIQASVTDSTGKTMTTYLNIMVVDAASDDKYVAACIDEPEAYEIFEQSTIDFNASGSRAIDSSGTDLDKSALNFRWTFDGTPKNDISLYQFTRLFATAGNHLAELVVEITSSPSDTSSTKADFLIAGCDVGGGISVGQCSADGRFFCAAPNTPLDTLESDGACKIEIPDSDDYNYCCPSGFECREGDEGLKCYQRTEDCMDYDTEDECKANSCRWIDGTCVEYDSSLSCSFYQEEDPCEEDVWNLGRTGAGTEICGTIIVEDVTLVPAGSCECVWDDGDGECKFKYDVQGIYGGPNAPKFSCLKFFTAGECIAGQQDLNWTATADNIQNKPYDEYPNQTDLINGDCISDSIIRSCGQPIVKLPGFTLINIISVLVILVVFYWFIKEYCLFLFFADKS